MKSKVTTPDGRVITVNHPARASQDQIIEYAKQQIVMLTDGPSMGPSEARSDLGPLMEATSERAEGIESEIPLLQQLQNKQVVSGEQGRSAIPLLTGMAASAGTGGLAAPALLFGGGMGVGEAIKRELPGPSRPESSAMETLTAAGETGAKGTRDAFLANLLFQKVLGPAGRFIFGKAPTQEGAKAVEFAKANMPTMSGQTSRRAATELGAPRLPLDSITDGKLLQAARGLLVGTKFSNTRATQAARFINRELASFAGSAPKASAVAGSARSALGLSGMVDDSAKWIDEFVNSSNLDDLVRLKAANPEVYQQVLAKNLEQSIGQFTRPGEGALRGLRVLDGQAFRTWVVNNSDELAKVYGTPVVRNLDDFSNYASFLDGAVSKAEEGIGVLSGTARAAIEGAGSMTPIFASPATAGIILPAQGASWALGNTLMNPSSATFSFFAALPKASQPIRLGFMEEAARREVGGQEQR